MNGVGYGITPFMGTHGILARSSGGGGGAFVNEYSMSFDGLSDYFTAGNTLNLANDGTDAFSISCWVKSTNLNTQILVGKQLNTTPYNGYNFAISGGAIRFFLGTTISSAYIQGTTGNLGTLLNGNWHHLVLTYDGSQDISGFTIYYDNATPTITTTLNNTPNGVSNSAEFMLGARGTTSSKAGFFDGNLDEVAYFNTELSASDVTAIYNSGIPTSLSSYPSLVSWWRMGDNDTWDGSSWILTDNGSGGNDASSNTTIPEGSRVTDVP